ncbi:MAG: NosD domain-containing protein [Promethearchaeota archaeon]
MRLKRQILIYSISITFVISLISGIILFNLFSPDSTKPECLEYYRIDYGILIDGNNQWEDISIGYNWCKGSGLPNDPYIIECLTIDGNSSFDCITILNSDVNFIIKNCIFSNASQYGMYFRNVSNGQLLDNIIRENRNGIVLSACNNIEIEKSDFIRNIYGLVSWGINNCLIKRNLFIENEQGIFWRDCINSQIDNNNFYNNTEYAINFYSHCDANQIINNLINLSSNGISTTTGDENNISSNKVISCRIGILNGGCLGNTFKLNKLYECGFQFGYFYDHPEYYRTNIIDKSNLINEKPLYFYFDGINLDGGDFLDAGQIILINCNDSIISDVDTSESTDGIFLTHCKNILIDNVISTNNSRFGIDVEWCNNINIANSVLSYNKWNGIEAYWNENLDLYYNKIENNTVSGINLQFSENLTIKDNEINKNYYGIEIVKPSWSSDLDLILISNNELGFNINSGIYMEYCDEETITNNNIHNNYLGISFIGCKSNLISQNEILSNQYGLILTYNSSDNTIFKNNFITNFIHYQFDNTSTGNLFLENIFI